MKRRRPEAEGWGKATAVGSSRRSHEWFLSRSASRESLTQLVAVVLFFLEGSSYSVQAKKSPTIDYTCDYYGDTCDELSLFDHVCDAEVASEPQCHKMDCFDCDPCQQYSYNCASCIENGCYWCPGDAICLSKALGANYWKLHNHRNSSCPTLNDWLTTCDDPAASDYVFGDPLYGAMRWSFELIKVESVWKQDVRGKGVQVRINDDGVDPFHEDFIAKFNYGASCDQYLPSSYSKDTHGTAVASIAVGDNNGACSVGIAPDAGLSACNLNGLGDAAYVFSSQLSSVDVSSNSWGSVPCKLKSGRRNLLQGNCLFHNVTQTQVPDNQNPCTICQNTTVSDRDCRQAIKYYCTNYFEYDPVACTDYLDIFVSCNYNALDQQTQEQLVQNIVNGRNGLGVIFVFPAGDENEYGSNGNFDGFVNSRFTISVGAVGKDGKYADYSTQGACVFVSAPGGDKEDISNNIVAKPSGGCREAGYGTSFAVPVVSGVVALMLGINNKLGWRDVQAILAETAQKVDIKDDSWIVNGANISHSYKYGFGVVDAEAAVAAARTWGNYGDELQVTVESGEINMTINDDPSEPTVSTINVESSNRNLATESVVIYVDLVHGSRGDLKLTLLSPSGTESLLAPSKRPENTQLGDNQFWKFSTFRTLGEDPIGTWTLKIVDEKPGVLSDCVDFYWYYSYNLDAGGKQTLTCDDFQFVTDCKNDTQVNPDILNIEYDGRTLLEACCACGGGTNATNIKNELKSWHMVVYGHTYASSDSGIVLIPPSNCPLLHDPCPFEDQFDGVCDAVLIPKCAGGDCVDCDPCRKFDADCNSCVRSGCHWCAGDAVCMSVKLEGPFWEQLKGKKTSSCTATWDWVTTCNDPFSVNVFEDPLYDAMAWSYKMINIEAVWEGRFTGRGVHIRINDDGVDANHTEFAGRFDIEHSCQDFLPVDYNVDAHGTACASLVAAAGNNDECAVGIAPGATISSCRFNEIAKAPEAFLNSIDAVDIHSNSWGPLVCGPRGKTGRRLQQCPFANDHPDSPCQACDNFVSGNFSQACEDAVSKYCSWHYEDDPIACAEYLDLYVDCQFYIVPMDIHDAFVRTITEGRNGRGIIYVFAAGNGYTKGVDVNDDGFTNSRFTLAVGAVGKDKKHASYSNTGAALFVSAPGGDFEDLAGNIVAKPGGGCHDITVGTSFAAPVVAGVVALMLELNPSLGWRDVQGILALSSQKFNEDDPSWTTNAAGYKHSYKYGFGVVSAADALIRTNEWTNFPEEKQLMNQSETLNLTIPNDPSVQINSSILISSAEAQSFMTESAAVYLAISHPDRGNLKIVLTSPSGTESLLQPSKRPEHTQLTRNQRWKLLTLRAWGEVPLGEWKLTVIDDKQRPDIGLPDCYDYPWEYSYTSTSNNQNTTLTCNDFRGVGNCTDEQKVNQALLDIVYQGRDLLEACCGCGGGLPEKDIPALLISWKLIVYGHSTIGDYSPPELVLPTPLPTPLPTASPTVSHRGTNGTDAWNDDIVQHQQNQSNNDNWGADGQAASYTKYEGRIGGTGNVFLGLRPDGTSSGALSRGRSLGFPMFASGTCLLCFLIATCK